MHKDQFQIGKFYQAIWGNNTLLLYVKDKAAVFWLANPSNRGATTFVRDLVETIDWIEVPFANLSLTHKQLLRDHNILIQTTAAPTSCTCESHFLFNNGCQCGYLKAQKTKT